MTDKKICFLKHFYFYFNLSLFSTQDSLDKCRYNRGRLQEEIDYLEKDLYAYKRRLERAYRPRIVIASRKEPNIKDIGMFKLYPRGVTDPPTWTYTGDRVWGVSNLIYLFIQIICMSCTMAERSGQIWQVRDHIVHE